MIAACKVAEDVHHSRKLEGKPGMFGSMTARAEAYVTRLACIYALLDQSKIIQPEHLEAAMAVWDFAEASIKYIFKDRLGDPVADDIYELLSAKPEGVSRTEINNHFQRHHSSDRISTALDLLQVLGFALKDLIPTEGRPKEVWKLNTKPECEISERSEKRYAN